MDPFLDNRYLVKSINQINFLVREFGLL